MIDGRIFAMDVFDFEFYAFNSLTCPFGHSLRYKFYGITPVLDENNRTTRISVT